MKSIYLAVIVILTSTVLTAQIQEVPIIGNSILQKTYQEEMAEIGMPDFDSDIQLRADCPIVNPDITYLFPADTFLIELDLSNDQAYELTDSASNIGSVRIDTSGEFAVFTAGNIAGAEEGTVVFTRTVDGENPTPEEYRFIVKRRNSSIVLPTEILMPGENITVCAEPTNSLPGNINCNDLFACADSYGGNDLQVYFFESSASDENCFKYFSARFPGLDTICVVLCDNFTVCDTFKQPFLIVGDTLNLPFFEDFSGGEIRPNSDRWLENLVFVNQTMPYNPPSIGAATFDGLDAWGVPYGGGYGTADRLTSKAFDLSNDNVNSGLVLSFYHQKKGRGFLPRVVDSLIVDFWTDSSEWVNVLAIPGSGFIPLDSFPEFNYTAISLDDPGYFHDGFQFRIRNKSQRTGAFGVWHVDYIRIDDTPRDLNNQESDDIALVEVRNDLLRNYTSMPLAQFKNHESVSLDSSFTTKFFNHNNTFSNVTRSYAELSIPVRGFSTFGIGDPFTLIDGQTANLPSRVIVSNTKTFEQTIFSTFLQEAEQIDINEQNATLEFKKVIITGDDFPQNDTSTAIVHLSNYFAYDDGTAERALEVNGNEAQLALEFEANVQSFLGAIKVHFPYTGSDLTTQQFNLKIWANGATLDDEPIYERFRIQPTRPDFIQGFTTFNLLNDLGDFEPISIEPGKFFIGFENVTNSTPPFSIGYDKNNPEASEFLWVNPGGNWTRFTDILPFQGALMVRPIMTQSALASQESFTTAVENNVSIYPNPAKETIHFNIETEDNESYNLQIFNTLGQIIHQDILDSQFNIAGYTAGIYFAKVTNLKTGYVQNLQFFKEK